MSDNIKFDYKKLSPFKWFVSENFPFIEADFDALTEWQLFCKIGKEINKIIDSQNIVGEQAETLTNAFNSLKNYVDNYFNNLDVQDEINNKLNEMATDGTLDTIINQEIFGNINNTLEIMNSKNTVAIGDSYAIGTSYPTSVNGWHTILCENLGLTLGSNFFSIKDGGAGFVSKGVTTNANFLELLQANINTISDKEKIKNVIVCGGYNDIKYDAGVIISNATEFLNYCKNIFPNAHIYIGMIANSNNPANKNKIFNNVLLAYRNACFNSIPRVSYLNGVENILSVKNFMSDDGTHPNQNGYNYLTMAIKNAFLSGYGSFHYNPVAWNITVNDDIFELVSQNNTIQYDNNFAFLNSNINLNFKTPTASTGSFVISKQSHPVVRGISNLSPLYNIIASIGFSDGSRRFYNGHLEHNNQNQLVCNVYIDTPNSLPTMTNLHIYARPLNIPSFLC